MPIKLGVRFKNRKDIPPHRPNCGDLINDSLHTTNQSTLDLVHHLGMSVDIVEVVRGYQSRAPIIQHLHYVPFRRDNPSTAPSYIDSNLMGATRALTYVRVDMFSSYKGHCVSRLLNLPAALLSFRKNDDSKPMAISSSITFIASIHIPD